MKKIEFIVTIFGNYQVGYLLSNIYSIYNTNPNASVIVLWQDIDENKMGILRKTFPKIKFLRTNINFSDNFVKRISSKIILWEYAARKCLNKKLCFMDVDTLVLKDLSDFFEKSDFNIIYTFENGQCPLNSGVLLSDGSKESVSFFKLWKQRTLEILSNRELLNQANDRNLCYGGADQMALFNILNYKRDNKIYTININGAIVNFKGVPCKFLNETNSTKITRDTHIIHYKGGWQLILLRGLGFSKNRPKDLSWEMYIYFLRNYKEAINLINRKLKTKYPITFFNIKIPFYLNLQNYKENKILYILFFILKKIQHFLFFGFNKVKRIINNYEN